MNPTLDAKAVTCPLCDAEPGEDCSSPGGKTLRKRASHAARKKAAIIEISNKPAKLKMHKKLKHKARARTFIYCDFHNEVHAAQDDIYQDATDAKPGCDVDNWRRVYVESETKKEDF